jgi:hypothetical protein
VNKKNFDRNFLRVILITNLLGIIPLILRKPPIKDWLLVYIYNAATNGIVDKILTTYKVVEYPSRFLPKLFRTHILFDYLIYPTFTVLYNQMTIKDKPFAIIYKLILITFPAFWVELWAVKKTNLIKWNKGWKWYHTFGSVIIKSLITRSFIGAVRIIDSKQQKVTSKS